MSFFVTPDAVENCFETAQHPKTFIDILYEHRTYLDNNKGFLGPKAVGPSKRVAIVGAGPAGLVAGWLLMKMGINPVIYESDAERVGGRVWSYYPVSGDPANFEMGAMRVPRAEQLFQYFADMYGMAHTRFPDPGAVDTLLYYKNKTYQWPAGGKPPAPLFTKVSKDWKRLVQTLTPVTRALQQGDYPTAQKRWQTFLTGSAYNWSTVSFFQGLKQQFSDWGVNEFGLFGALGIGSGGFGPLYQVNFAEIARLVINGLESCQQFYPGGLGALPNGLYQSSTSRRGLPDASLARLGAVQFKEKVERVFPQPDGTIVVASSSGQKPYDAVIIATSTRSMQVDLGIANPPEGQEPAISEAAMTGVRKLHLMNSSKLFALTKTKFWLQAGIPANIQTDGLCRGVYCLDYGPGTHYGVVLVSYTWGDDSTKLLAVQPAEDRFKTLVESLKPADSGFTDALLAQTMQIKNVDWELEPDYFGAFKLNYPGQGAYNQSVYYQFLAARGPNTDKGVYLAGDSVSWSGGWIEGALQTGMNAAAAVAYRLGGGMSALHDKNPMTQNPTQYNYGV